MIEGQALKDELMFELGMAQAARAMSDFEDAALHLRRAEMLAHPCPMCQTQTLAHMDGCPHEDWAMSFFTPVHCGVGQLAAMIAVECISRGVVLDDDFIRLNGLTGGRWVFAPVNQTEFLSTDEFFEDLVTPAPSENPCLDCPLKEQSVPYGSVCLECKYYEG